MNSKPNTKFLRAIYGAARAHGVNNQVLHDMIWFEWQKKSLKDLTPAQSMELLDTLNGKTPSKNFSSDRRRAMASHGRRDYDSSGDAAYMINERERRMLQEAAALRGWSLGGLQHFIERQLKHEQIRTMAEFNKVFWALKAMNRRDGLCK
ncbi:MAG: hypothetical protein ACM3ZB_07010 [bacterium]